MNDGRARQLLKSIRETGGLFSVTHTDLYELAHELRKVHHDDPSVIKAIDQVYCRLGDIQRYADSNREFALDAAITAGIIIGSILHKLSVPKSPVRRKKYEDEWDLIRSMNAKATKNGWSQKRVIIEAREAWKNKHKSEMALSFATATAHFAKKVTARP